MFQEFPKALYLKGWDDLSAAVTVNSAEEEESARKDGYKGLNEQAEGAEAPARKKRSKAEPEVTEQAEGAE